MIAIGKVGNKLMASLLKRLEKWGRQAFKASTLDKTAAVAKSYVRDPDWLAARHRFLWQRLQLWLLLALICLLTFTLRNIYDVFFPLKEFEKLPDSLRTQGLFINVAILLTLIVCFILHKTQFGQRYPGLLFLGSSWSISLGSQFFATLKGFALPDTLGWSLLFLSQATFIPVCWRLHLTSQVGLLIYYFGVNTALGLKTPIPVFWCQYSTWSKNTYT